MIELPPQRGLIFPLPPPRPPLVAQGDNLQGGRDRIEAIQLPADLAGSAVDVIVTTDGKVWTILALDNAVPTGLFPTLLKVVNGTSSVAIDSTGVTITTSGGKTCVLAFSALTQNMTLRELDVCSGGVAKKILVLASAAY